MMFGKSGYLLGAITLVSSVLSDPFSNYADAKGQIETGYGADNATFTRYRPQYHFIGPVNWLNDPSAPYFDGEHYHIYYQHNPFDQIWGNMTWGHAVSNDLIHWQDKPFALYPDQNYDMEGAFDGTILKNGYQNKTTLVYTGVSQLPLHWTLNYTPGQEKQILAYTEDNGDTFVKVGAVMDAPPEGFNVTGFRDPYLFRSPQFDKLLNQTDSVYCTVSSGIQNEGPRLWLYRTSNWTSWDYLGPIIASPMNGTRNEKYCGYYGYNYEVASQFVLRDEGQDFYVSTYGSEGGRATHNAHWGLWSAGKELEVLQPDGNMTRAPTPHVKELMGGVVDWGNNYAGLVWADDNPKTKYRHIYTGWVTEDIVGNNSNGWDGMFSLNRELFIHDLKNVSTNDPKLNLNASWYAEDNGSSQTKTVKTLGIKPLGEYYSLRNESKHWALDGRYKRNTDLSNFSVPVNTKHAEIEALFQYSADRRPGKFGFAVLQSGDEETLIQYDPQEESIVIDRSRSSLDGAYNNATESGPMPLFLINEKGKENKLEALRLHIYIDNSIIEVYANDRFALSTRVYPTQDGTGMSLRIPNDVYVRFINVFSEISVNAFDRP